MELLENYMIRPNKRELVKMGLWLIDGDVGLSSKALMSFFLTSGNGGGCASKLVTPSDPSDFNRCIKFLDCLDKGNRTSLIYEIGNTTMGWKKVLDNWFVLNECYEKGKKGGKGSAPELYQLMKKIGL